MLRWLADRLRRRTRREYLSDEWWSDRQRYEATRPQFEGVTWKVPQGRGSLWDIARDEQGRTA